LTPLDVGGSSVRSRLNQRSAARELARSCRSIALGDGVLPIRRATTACSAAYVLQIARTWFEKALADEPCDPEQALSAIAIETTRNVAVTVSEERSAVSLTRGPLRLYPFQRPRASSAAPGRRHSATSDLRLTLGALEITATSSICFEVERVSLSTRVETRQHAPEIGGSDAPLARQRTFRRERPVR